jgi:hypothetical protein
MSQTSHGDLCHTLDAKQSKFYVYINRSGKNLHQKYKNDSKIRRKKKVVVVVVVVLLVVVVLVAAAATIVVFQ